MSDATSSNTERERALLGWDTFQKYARWVWLSEQADLIKDGRFEFPDQVVGFGGSRRINTLRELAASFIDGLNEDLLAELIEVALAQEFAEWNVGIKPQIIRGLSSNFDVLQYYSRHVNKPLVSYRLAQKDLILATLTKVGMIEKGL